MISGKKDKAGNAPLDGFSKKQTLVLCERSIGVQ